jgi:hypothetical protein
MARAGDIWPVVYLNFATAAGFTRQPTNAATDALVNTTSSMSTAIHLGGD